MEFALEEDNCLYKLKKVVIVNNVPERN